MWLIPAMSLTLCAQDGGARPLEDVAAIATVMVDGDLARRIETPRSVESALKKDPKDPWAASDNYDVDHASFNAMKKTLIRLARLCQATCDVNLWMPVRGVADRVQVVIRNVNEMSQFWPWGALNQPMPPEMKQVLDTGRQLTVRKRPGMVSVLTPVYDSLGDVVGLVEVVSMAKPDPQENVL
jgi:hypothetical protein